MWEPKLRTPGMARELAADALGDAHHPPDPPVPGLFTKCIRKSRSLKSGNSDSPRAGQHHDAHQHRRRDQTRSRPADDVASTTRKPAAATAPAAIAAARAAPSRAATDAHRRDRERDHHRRQDGQAVGHRQRPEERGRHAAHEEHRHQHHRDDQRGVDDGLAHLERRLEDDRRRTWRGCPSPRCWRNRRTIFSTSMIASSTTTPIAITNPARIIVLIVAPAPAAPPPPRPATAGSPPD